jgi:hypothetical protein
VTECGPQATCPSPPRPRAFRGSAARRVDADPRCRASREPPHRHIWGWSSSPSTTANCPGCRSARSAPSDRTSRAPCDRPASIRLGYGRFRRAARANIRRRLRSAAPPAFPRPSARPLHVQRHGRISSIGKVDPDRVARDIGFARQRIDFGLGQARASRAARCRDRACPPRSSPCRVRPDALGERHQCFPCVAELRDVHVVVGKIGIEIARTISRSPASRVNRARSRPRDSRGDLRILAFAGKQRQVDADPNRDHVAIGRIAPTVARVLTRQSGRLSARARPVSASASVRPRRRAPCRRGSEGMPAIRLSRSTSSVGGIARGLAGRDRR